MILQISGAGRQAAQIAHAGHARLLLAQTFLKWRVTDGAHVGLEDGIAVLQELLLPTVVGFVDFPAARPPTGSGPQGS